MVPFCPGRKLRLDFGTTDPQIWKLFQFTRILALQFLWKCHQIHFGHRFLHAMQKGSMLKKKETILLQTFLMFNFFRCFNIESKNDVDWGLKSFKFIRKMILMMIYDNIINLSIHYYLLCIVPFVKKALLKSNL